jgi:hypothetical protein
LPLHERQRAHDQVRGAIAPRGLELELRPIKASFFERRVIATAAIRALHRE